MLTEDVTQIRQRAEALQKNVGKMADLIEGESEVGGGSVPGAKLATWLGRPDPQPVNPDPPPERPRARPAPRVVPKRRDQRLLDAPDHFPRSARDRAPAPRGPL